MTRILQKFRNENCPKDVEMVSCNGEDDEYIYIIYLVKIVN